MYGDWRTGSGCPEATTPVDTSPRPWEVERLRTEEPELFEALTTAVAGGYFMSPEVRGLLGYPGQMAKPLEDDFDRELLQPMIDRGPIFRPAP